MKSLFIIISAIFISCNGQKKPAMEQTDATANSPLTLLLQDNYSGSDVTETLIIKDAKSLQLFYSKINRTRKPGLPVPEIDFTKNMIVIYCSGVQKGSAKTDLSFLEETDHAIILHPAIETPSTETSQTAETSPFSMYKMPLTEKKIEIKVKDTP